MRIDQEVFGIQYPEILKRRLADSKNARVSSSFFLPCHESYNLISRMSMQSVIEQILLSLTHSSLRSMASNVNCPPTFVLNMPRIITHSDMAGVLARLGGVHLIPGISWDGRFDSRLSSSYRECPANPRVGHFLCRGYHV